MSSTARIGVGSDRSGFRNETDLESADIVCIGDSFTETGTSGTHTFPAILAQLTGCTVANLGVGTYSAQQELEVFRHSGLRLTPKVLIWQVFEGNDLRETVEYEKWKHGIQPSRSTLKETHLQFRLVMRRLLNRSVGLKTLRRVFMPSRMQFSYEPAGDTDEVGNHQGWKPFEAALMEGTELAKQKGSRVILLFFPCKASLYQPEAQRPGMTARLQRFAQDHEIDYIDMWEVFRERYVQSGEVYYWFNDTHISEAGCRLTAQVLAQQIGCE